MLVVVVFSLFGCSYDLRRVLVVCDVSFKFYNSIIIKMWSVV